MASPYDRDSDQNPQNFHSWNGNKGCHNQVVLNLNIEPSPSPIVLQISPDLHENHGLRLITRVASDQDNIDSAATDNCPISTTSEDVSPARVGPLPRHERNSGTDKGLTNEHSNYAATASKKGLSSDYAAPKKDSFIQKPGKGETPSVLEKFMLYTRSVISRNIFGSELSTRPKKLKLYSTLVLENVEDYIPKDNMKPDLRRFMRSEHLPTADIIPIWNPISARGAEMRGRVRIDVGDVGTFTQLGGFQVAFNILLDEKTNDLCGYATPPDYTPFRVVPRFDSELDSERAQSRKIKDDGKVINLDACGAIDTRRCFSSGSPPLCIGFDISFDKSSPKDDHRHLSISPVKSNKGHTFLYLPCGLMKYEFSRRATSQVVPYLITQLPNWLEHFKALQIGKQSPLILLTAVWVAKRFACATYTGKLSSKSPKAELWSDKGDRDKWKSVDSGFTTTIAPMDEGYDSDGKLISDVEDQCVGVEGHVFRIPKK